MSSKPVFNLYGQLVYFADGREPEKPKPSVISTPAPRPVREKDAA